METNLSEQLDGTLDLMKRNTNALLNVEKLSHEYFLKAMAWLEAVRNENFPEETLEVWYREFVRLKWSREQFRDAVISVSRSKLYGKTSIDCFLFAERFYTSEEVNQLTEQRIQNRKQEYLNLKNYQANEEELASQGLIFVQQWWQGELKNQIDKHAERLEKKCKRLRAQFHLLPQQAKDDLWIKAVEKGIVQDGDKFTEQILPMLVPQMIEDFEIVIKNAIK